MDPRLRCCYPPRPSSAPHAGVAELPHLVTSRCVADTGHPTAPGVDPQPTRCCPSAQRCRGRQCSVRSLSPLAGVLTLTCTKRSLGRAAYAGPNGCCTRWCGRRHPASPRATRHRPLRRHLDWRYRPKAACWASQELPDARAELFRVSRLRSSRSWPPGAGQRRTFSDVRERPVRTGIRLPSASRRSVEQRPDHATFREKFTASIRVASQRKGSIWRRRSS